MSSEEELLTPSDQLSENVREYVATILAIFDEQVARDKGKNRDG